ncbi:type III-B CRISPR module RAMP protein Cmr6 [Psychrobacter jeotgali]|uniref:type III-B CRISPR module RAMP protein Cmr6 n=1 Tax=Psychrobacter jeotgali TaxID=179010 RepID=UPI001918CC1A|nr:type III-B CRISPR module RAMP protein Cmr6 [Psychrobacter jeotgali]
MLPIYNQENTTKKAESVFKDDSTDGHLGVWYERFYTYHIFDSQGGLIADPDAKKTAKIREKESFFTEFWGQSGQRQCGNSSLLKNYAMRQRLLCHAQQGIATSYNNTWQIAVGLGNSHPLDNGMLWHPTLGVPYFQGSTVKGMAKALMEKWGADPKLIKRWFGSVNLLQSKHYSAKLFNHNFGYDIDEKTKEELSTQATGSFIFLDAIPTKPVMLVQSIMTPHYGKWYEKGDTQPLSPEAQPGDWHAPIPVSFLAVENASMQFGVMPRLGAHVTEEETKQLANIITIALEHLGIGAKTATGYGRMLLDKAENSKLQNEQDALIEEEKARIEEQKRNQGKSAEQIFLDDFRDHQTPEVFEFYQKIMTWSEEQKLLVKEAYELIIKQPSVKKDPKKKWVARLTLLVEKLKDFDTDID